MNTHDSLTQSLFQDMLTVPERDYSSTPWDNARNVAAGKSTEFEPTGNAKFDALVRALNPTLVYGEDSPPAYEFVHHVITMPHRDSFADPAEYLSTFAHELCHWTMQRAGRKPHFGDPLLYAREEQTAEIACAIVLQECGADPQLDARADYVRGWIVGAMEALTERAETVAKLIGIDPPTFGREDVDREYANAVQRAEEAANVILSAGSAGNN